MRYVIQFVIILACYSGIAMADKFADQKAEAIKLMDAWKNAEALKIFEDIAPLSPNDTQKSEVLEKAAYCAYRLRHQNPAMERRAMEIAKQIPRREILVKCSMTILMETGQASELITQFQNENIAAFSKDIGAAAFYLRGKAYVARRRGKEAEADFKSALVRSSQDEMYLMALAENYWNNLKDKQKTLDIYQQIINAPKPSSRAIDASVAVARIHIDDAEYGKALAAFENYKDLSTLPTYQRVQVLRASAEAYAALGQEEEAVSRFEEANNLEGRK